MDISNVRCMHPLLKGLRWWRPHPAPAWLAACGACIRSGPLQSWCVSQPGRCRPANRGGRRHRTGMRRRGSASPAMRWTRCSGRGRALLRRAQERVAAAAVPRFGNCSAGSKPSPPSSWRHFVMRIIREHLSAPSHAAQFSTGLTSCIVVVAAVQYELET